MKPLSEDEQMASLMRNINREHFDDLEVAHGKADELLCEILMRSGFPQTVMEYQKIDKWYA